MSIKIGYLIQPIQHRAAALVMRGICLPLLQRKKAYELSVAADNFSCMENLQGFEGLSALEESAVRLHEIYKSLMTGGFTEDEALSLIAKMTRNSPPS